MLLSKDSNVKEITHNCTIQNFEQMLESKGSPMLSVNFVTDDIKVNPEGNNMFGEIKIYLDKNKLHYGQNIIVFAFDILSQKYDSLEELMDLYYDRFYLNEGIIGEEDYLSMSFASIYLPGYGFLGTSNYIPLVVYKILYTSYLHEYDQVTLWDILDANPEKFSFGNYTNEEIKEWYTESIWNIIEFVLERTIYKHMNIIPQEIEDYIKESLEYYKLPILDYQKKFFYSILEGMKDEYDIKYVVGYLLDDYIRITRTILDNLYVSLEEMTEEELESYELTLDHVKEFKKLIDILFEKYKTNNLLDLLGITEKDYNSILNKVSWFFYISDNEYTEGLVFPLEGTDTVPLDYWEKVRINKTDWEDYDIEQQEWIKSIFNKYNIKLEIKEETEEE